MLSSDQKRQLAARKAELIEEAKLRKEAFQEARSKAVMREQIEKCYKQHIPPQCR